MPGRFISFEGGEGTGKSTQTTLLAEALEARGHDVIQTREPGGTPGGEAVRELLLDAPERQWTARSEALLFTAARAQHVADVILPSLNAGKWVICDRFVDSSRAYQVTAGGLRDDEILALHAMGSNGLLPDRTILLDMGPDLATDEGQAVGIARAARRDGRASDRIGGRAAAFHANVADRFRAMAAREPDRFAIVDASNSIADIHDRILHVLGIGSE